MNTLSAIVYCPLREEESKKVVGWSKVTIDYAIQHKNKVTSTIKGIAKRQGKSLSAADVEDIYIEFLTYLYECEDYDIQKAAERSNKTGSIISIEAYVHSCAKFCTIRHVTRMYKEEGNIVKDVIKKDSDGKEYSLFDSIADDRTSIELDRMMYKLDSICQNYEYQRYHLGTDIFLIWFIRLKTIQLGKQDKYEDIIKLLGISKKELAKAEQNAQTDGIMLNIAKAITLITIDEAISIIRGYTYCVDKIEEIIESI